MTGPVEQAGKVAQSTIEAFRNQPRLLFLTLVNIAFLVFVYLAGSMVKDAYDEQQRQINDRYALVLRAVDRCMELAFQSPPLGQRQELPAPQPHQPARIGH